MKREDVLAILEDENLDNAAKLQRILDINGTDINGKNARIRELEDAAGTHATQLQAERDRYKDYEAILQERDALKTEKEKRVFDDRFSAVLGKNVPKNDFTRAGLEEMFKGELAKPENASKKDADIFATMISGKEKEFFDSPIRLNMTPSNPAAKIPTDTESYIDEVYRDNPYYKKIN
jgi:hypothetical protein